MLLLTEGYGTGNKKRWRKKSFILQSCVLVYSREEINMRVAFWRKGAQLVQCSRLAALCRTARLTALLWPLQTKEHCFSCLPSGPPFPHTRFSKHIMDTVFRLLWWDRVCPGPHCCLSWHSARRSWGGGMQWRTWEVLCSCLLVQISGCLLNGLRTSSSSFCAWTWSPSASWQVQTLCIPTSTLLVEYKSGYDEPPTSCKQSCCASGTSRLLWTLSWWHWADGTRFLEEESLQWLFCSRSHSIMETLRLEETMSNHQSITDCIP